MATIRGYMGVSVDGYIASTNGSLDWLRKYDGVDFGAHAYDRFIREIRTVVMGRDTYEAVRGFGEGWHYGDQRSIIVTSRPLENPIGPLEVWPHGFAPLVERLRALDDGDVWVVGGGRLQQAFIAAGALDRLELFVVPEIVGGGLPTFPPNGFSRSIRLAEASALEAGVAYLDYRFDAPAV